MRNPIRRLTSLTSATVLITLFGTTAGLAAATSATGGPLIQVSTRASTDVAITSSNSYVNVPTGQVKIVIPAAGGSRLVVARFSAESLCLGSGGGEFCLVQIVAFNVGTSVSTEMHPQAGPSFGFDSIGDTPSVNDNWEAHSMERSLRLAPGTYSIRVQFSVTGETNFQLDDWHLTISQYD